MAKKNNKSGGSSSSHGDPSYSYTKKQLKKEHTTGMLQFIEQMGLSAIVTPPMKLKGGKIVVYDCLLRRVATIGTIYERVTLPIDALSPDIVTIFRQLSGKAKLYNFSGGSISAFHKAQRGTGQKLDLDALMVLYQECARAEHELHNLLGCEAFGYVMESMGPA